VVLRITNQAVRFAQVLNQTPKFSIMKKLALVLTVFTASIIGAKAQSSKSTGDVKFGIGLDAALPIGNAGDAYKFGIGGQAQVEYGFAENLKGIFSAGYTSYSGKTIDIPGFGSQKIPSVAIIPILVGARYYASESFFVGAQIGYGKFTGNGASGGGFEYRPQVGYVAGPVQIVGSYDGVSNNGTFSGIHLGIAYTFGGQ